MRPGPKAPAEPAEGARGTNSYLSPHPLAHRRRTPFYYSRVLTPCADGSFRLAFGFTSETERNPQSRCGSVTLGLTLHLATLRYLPEGGKGNTVLERDVEGNLLLPSRSSSDSPPDCHSLPSRRCATYWGRLKIHLIMNTSSTAVRRSPFPCWGRLKIRRSPSQNALNK